MTENDHTDPFDAASPEARLRAAGRPRTPGVRVGRLARTAARRAAREESREEAREEPRAPLENRLYRRRTRSGVASQFDIDKTQIPPGMSYEWKRAASYGWNDTNNMNEMRENHWTAVPASRHPHMMEPGAHGAVQKDGMVLCERPAYLTREAIEENYQEAMGRVRRQEGIIRSGEKPSADHFDRRNAKLQHSYEPIRVPEQGHG